MDGHVMFKDMETFNTAHEQAKIFMILPRKGKRNKRLASNKQQTIAVALPLNNLRDRNDLRIICFVKSRMWPTDLLGNFSFLSENEVEIFFPVETDP